MEIGDKVYLDIPISDYWHNREGVCKGFSSCYTDVEVADSNGVKETVPFLHAHVKPIFRIAHIDVDTGDTVYTDFKSWPEANEFLRTKRKNAITAWEINANGEER